MPWHHFLPRLPFVFREGVCRLVALLLSVPQPWALHRGVCTGWVCHRCAMTASPTEPCWDRYALPGGQCGSWLVRIPNHSCRELWSFHCMLLSCAAAQGQGPSWHHLRSPQDSEGTPFQAENESLHISPSKRSDPSTQLLGGFCLMQSAPSHTRQEGKGVTLSASQPRSGEPTQVRWQ